MRLYCVTRSSDGYAELIVGGHADEALASWRRYAWTLADVEVRDVEVRDVGGTDDEHVEVQSHGAVLLLRNTACDAARAYAREWFDEGDHAYAISVGAHRRLGVLRFEVATRIGLDGDVRDAVWEIPEAYAWSRGAKAYAAQLIADAALAAFGDEVDELMARAGG